MGKRFALIIFALLLFLLPKSLALAAPDQANSTFLATPTHVPADGVTQASVTVTMLDSSSLPVVGDDVFLTISGDLTASIATVSGITNANGQATFTVTSTTAGTDSVNVSDTTAGVTFVAMGSIIFDTVTTSSNTSNNGTPGPFVCTKTYPSAPELYAITQESSGSATLYFVQPASAFDGFTISYGLTSSADSYNVTFAQGSSIAAIKYTINYLTSDKTYYFKVRANNGCATGIWSSTQTINSNTNFLPEVGPGSSFLLTAIGGFLMLVVGAIAFAVL